MIDQLDPEQKQKLLRLLVEEVRVTGWNVQIQLRIPLDAESQDQPPPGQTADSQCQAKTVCVPFVWQTWAWCSSRSTVAVARVLGMSSSNPAGCRFEEIATERFS